MYNRGETTTHWDTDELAVTYPLSTSNFLLDPADSVAGTVDVAPAAPVDPVDPITAPQSESTGNVGAVSTSGNSFIEQTIQCIVPGEGISFEVNPVNFPVYITGSKYNSDKNYDYGAFSHL